MDVLWFNEPGTRVRQTGVPVDYADASAVKNHLEYSAKVQMSLTWNEKMNMLVFDHLSPSKPSYTGNYSITDPILPMTASSLKKAYGYWWRMWM